jgi:hypothetical protein
MKRRIQGALGEDSEKEITIFLGMLIPHLVLWCLEKENHLAG